MTDPSTPDEPRGPLHARPFWFVLVSFCLAGTLGYRLLYMGGMTETAALFVGLPAVLAYYLVWMNPAGGGPYRTMTTCMTFFLLLSAVVLGEGTVCLIFIAPVAYAMGFATTWLFVRVRGDKRRRQRHIMRVCFALPLVLLAAEGVLPYSTIERDQVLHLQRSSSMSVDEVAERLDQAMRFEEPWAWLLSLGFPLPQYSERDGDQRRVIFGGDEGYGEHQIWVRQSSCRAKNSAQHIGTIVGKYRPGCRSEDAERTSVGRFLRLLDGRTDQGFAAVAEERRHGRTQCSKGAFRQFLACQVLEFCLDTLFPCQVRNSFDA